MQHLSYFKTHNPMLMNIETLVFSWKTFISFAGGWILSFLLPAAPFLIFTIVLVFSDLVTGTRAAKKRKEKIHSRGLRRTVEKMVLFFIAILLSEGFRVVFIPVVPVTYMTALAISLTELKSNLENIEVVTGVKIWDKISSKIQMHSKKFFTF